MKKEIIINVCGTTGTGKSSVVLLLVEFFSKMDCEMEIELGSIDDVILADSFFQNKEKFIEMLKTRKIIINEVQLPHKPLKYE